MMSDRKAELERKKAKLQAIREEKERRRREKEQKDVRNFYLNLMFLIILHVYVFLKILYQRSRKLQFVLQERIKIIGKNWMLCFHPWV